MRLEPLAKDCFRKLLPLAPQANLRLVLVNRPDSGGSSKYSDDELLLARESRGEFLKLTASHTSKFLAWFVTEHAIPRLSKETHTGGFVTVGWSHGATSYVIPTLS